MYESDKQAIWLSNNWMYSMILYRLIPVINLSYACYAIHDTQANLHIVIIWDTACFDFKLIGFNV